MVNHYQYLEFLKSQRWTTQRYHPCECLLFEVSFFFRFQDGRMNFKVPDKHEEQWNILVLQKWSFRNKLISRKTYFKVHRFRSFGLQHENRIQPEYWPIADCFISRVRWKTSWVVRKVSIYIHWLIQKWFYGTFPTNPEWLQIYVRCVIVYYVTSLRCRKIVT